METEAPHLLLGEQANEKHRRCHRAGFCPGAFVVPVLAISIGGPLCKSRSVELRWLELIGDGVHVWVMARVTPAASARRGSAPPNWQPAGASMVGVSEPRTCNAGKEKVVGRRAKPGDDMMGNGSDMKGKRSSLIHLLRAANETTMVYQSEGSACSKSRCGTPKQLFQRWSRK